MTIEYRNATISYGKKVVIENASLKFMCGCITSVIGPNGCGKTTLLQSLIGASKVTGGDILLDGMSVLGMNPKERARRIAFLPQVRSNIPSLTVAELVRLGRYPHLGVGRGECEADYGFVYSAMEYAGVLDYADCSVETLSGGVRQRAYLAMILAQDCPYVVLDEPTTYIDAKGQKEFMDLIRGLKAKGKTIVMVLHDINQAAEVSDNLVFMKAGHVVAAGRKTDCLSKELVENLFDIECKKISDEGRDYFFFV